MLEPILENDLFKSISVILDSSTYQFMDCDVIYDDVLVVVDHFKNVLLANGCNMTHLKEEFELLHDHIKRYVSKVSAEKC